MLIHEYDLDRAFDRVLTLSLPYLVFPPNEFRVELGNKISSLYQYYRERNTTAFSVQRDLVEREIINAAFDDITERKIRNFIQQQQPLDETLSDLDKRVADLELGKRRGHTSGRGRPVNIPLVTGRSGPDVITGKDIIQSSFGEPHSQEVLVDPPDEDVNTRYSQKEPVISRVVRYLMTSKGDHRGPDIACEIGASKVGVRDAIRREIETNGVYSKHIQIRQEDGPRGAYLYSWIDLDDSSPPLAPS